MLPGLYLDHIVLRVHKMAETELFWSALLGKPEFKDEESLMYIVGATRLFFTSSLYKTVESYDKECGGLNHLAFGVRSSEELRLVLDHLKNAGLQNSGVKIDHYGNKEFIWLDDPNSFRVEFYCRPE
ncbi:MAG TPA: VOC family protein [Acidobacteriaceae bacterium]|jgi:catechol-2,3-dioxygenase|nr:VOC family protein [Acidobacteriaceae bacterium]